MDSIAQILSDYITRRDALIKDKNSPFYVSGNTGIHIMSKFSQMVDAHHIRLFLIITVTNIAECEALAELVNSHLNWMRNQHNS